MIKTIFGYQYSLLNIHFRPHEYQFTAKMTNDFELY